MKEKALPEQLAGRSARAPEAGCGEAGAEAEGAVAGTLAFLKEHHFQAYLSTANSCMNTDGDSRSPAESKAMDMMTERNGMASSHLDDTLDASPAIPAPRKPWKAPEVSQVGVDAITRVANGGEADDDIFS